VALVVPDTTKGAAAADEGHAGKIDGHAARGEPTDDVRRHFRAVDAQYAAPGPERDGAADDRTATKFCGAAADHDAARGAAREDDVKPAAIDRRSTIGAAAADDLRASGHDRGRVGEAAGTHEECAAA